MKKLLLFLGLSLGFTGAQAATSLSQYGIVWTWQEDRSTGQFANGDWWVIGPITLTGTTPQSIPQFGGAITNGSMINPVPSLYPDTGFDSRIGGYQEALNMGRKSGAPLSVSNTREVPAGSSICTMTSREFVGPDGHALFDDFAVLTVVATAPAAGSFRPPYTGTDKTIRWNKSSLNYSILKNLAPVSGMSSPTSSALARPWVEISTDFNAGRDLRALNNQTEYDRNLSWDVSKAGLELHQNYSNATKELAFVRIVQLGIDIYGAMKYGVIHYGGNDYSVTHGNTYGKLPIVLAALALGDSDIRYYANAANKVVGVPYGGSYYLEDRFYDGGANYVNESHIGAATSDGYLGGDPRPRYTYPRGMLGLPEWGIPLAGVYVTSGSNWGIIYRNVRYGGLAGADLAAKLTTGAPALYNQACLDYFDRAFSTYSGGAGGNPAEPAFVIPAWDAWRAVGSTVWTQAAPISGIAWIPVTGTTLNIEYTDNTTGGAGGNGGVVLHTSTGDLTATYVSGNGSTTRTFSLPRTIGADETLMHYSFTQPGNGAESLSGADVASVSHLWVVNYKAGEGGGGGRVEWSGGGGTAPSAPSGLTATVISSTQINLSWSDNASNETGFAVELSLNNSTWTSIATPAANTTTLSATSLSASTLYYFRVRATNASGSSSNATASTTTSSVSASAPPVARVRRGGFLN